jgi:alpha-tubulin suppressor-like RCC1 family protein|tara:strand:+ start:1201 stop:2325 length:1125 start_codon:yes stop_codon:yes gene_type:complete
MTNIRRALQAAAGVGGGSTISAMAFGNGDDGQLGLGNTTQYTSPVMIGAKDTWSKVGAGRRSTIAVKADGTLWTWGRNNYGQLGDGSVTYRCLPTQVGALEDWAQPSMAFESSGCVKTDGTFWTWGSSTNGVLGNGTGNGNDISSPVQVGSLTDWSLANFGSYHGMAVKTDGTLWAWGANYYGPLCQGNNTTTSSPVQIGALTTWLTVEGGYGFTTAIKTDGTIWAGGRNSHGQLGRGTTSTRETTIGQIGALTTWSKVACTHSSAVAVKTDGTLWGWGRNNNGQLGQGNTTDYSSPVQIGALTDWSKVYGSADGGAFFAIKTDGTLWGVGNNENGELGDGSTTKRSSPVQIGALTTWVEAATGSNFTIALEDS